jgi:hypothetical protein
MPKQAPHSISLRADDAYKRYLDRLIRALKKERGTTIKTYHQLADYALAVLGLSLNLKAPPRMKRPVGRPKKAPT